MAEVTTIGLDIAKHGFHAHGADAPGRVPHGRISAARTASMSRNSARAKAARLLVVASASQGSSASMSRPTSASMPCADWAATGRTPQTTNHGNVIDAVTTCSTTN